MNPCKCSNVASESQSTIWDALTSFGGAGIAGTGTGTGADAVSVSEAGGPAADEVDDDGKGSLG